MSRMRAVGRLWRREVGWKGTGLFFYVWLMVGFASGTLVLLGPARWLTATVRAQGWGQGVEDLAMIAVMIAYVALSFLLAVYLTRHLLAYRARAFKTGVVLAVTLAAAAALWGWMNPALYASMAGGGTEEEVAMRSGARFVFGAYPDRERLAELKAQGVAAVVSLQHPAVVPFEPEGIAREREWTRELGMRFVHAPMLPWVSDNAAALDTIRRLAREGEGTYYVHCGLGRDRVNVVRRMLEQMGGRVELAGDAEAPRALTWADRGAEGLGPMERGEPVQLEEGVWLVPHPNEHELFGHMLGGQVAHVLLLLDPTDPAQAEWQEEIRRRFDAYALPYTASPLPEGDTAAARMAAEEARDLPRPLTVIAPFTPPEGDTAVAAAFQRAWRGGSAGPSRAAP